MVNSAGQHIRAYLASLKFPRIVTLNESEHYIATDPSHSLSSRLMRGLVLSKYGPLAAATRQRFLQFRPALEDAGIDLQIEPLLNDTYLEKLFAGKRPSRRVVARAYRDRLRLLRSAEGFDFIWLYLEAFPYLPDGFERLVNRLDIPVIYDCDDAIHTQYQNHKNPLVRTVLGNKIAKIQSRSELCLCGNAVLRDYAAQNCPRAEILPTVVDTDAYQPTPRSNDRPVTIGWIGAPSTWPYVTTPLRNVLSKLKASHNIAVKIIGAHGAEEGESGFDYVTWREETEIAEVQSCDIGIMPLPDDPWARGKSGYKLIQYMACSLPVVASPVGANKDIVSDGANGFLRTTAQDWEDALVTLINDAALRREMGAAGRKTVEQHYSLAAQAPNLVRLFKDILT